MWSFWDALTVSVVMAARDYYKQRERNILRRNQFKQKCMESISHETTEICHSVEAVVKKQRTAYMSGSIGDGVQELPMYAFYLVLRNQSTSVTKEQITVIDIFAANFSLPYSVQDFLRATKQNNDVRSYVEGLVGISKNHAGDFWKDFFKSIYRTDTEEKVVTDIIRKFSDIVMNFSIIGDAKTNHAEYILEKFMEDVGFQSANCRSLPKDSIDIYGDSSYIEHYHIFEEEYRKTIKLTKADEDGLPAFEIYPYFCMGVIYQVIEQSAGDVENKALCIDYIMTACGMRFGYTGKEIIEAVQSILRGVDNELGWWITNLLDADNENLCFWQILATLIGLCKEKGYDTPLVPELCGFLIGMDGELDKKFPLSGFGDIAKPYLTMKLSELNELIDRL